MGNDDVIITAAPSALKGTSPIFKENEGGMKRKEPASRNESRFQLSRMRLFDRVGHVDGDRNCQLAGLDRDCDIRGHCSAATTLTAING